MEKRFLALIIGAICTQTRLTLLLEMDKRGLISHDTVGNSLTSIYEESAHILEIITKLLKEEDEKR